MPTREECVRWELQQGALRGNSDEYMSNWLVDRNLGMYDFYYDELIGVSGGNPSTDTVSTTRRFPVLVWIVVGLVVLLLLAAVFYLVPILLHTHDTSVQSP